MSKTQCDALVNAVSASLTADDISCTPPPSPSSQCDVNDVRNEYLKAFEETDIQQWVTAAAKKITAILHDETESTTHPPPPVIEVPIQLREGEGGEVASNFQICSVIDNVMTIGRCVGCTYVIPATYENASRLQCVLMWIRVRTGNWIIVIVDYWSLYGTSIGETGQKSVPGSRKILFAPIDTPITLILSHNHTQLPLVLNPRMCLLCMERPRTEVMSCDHLIGCEECVSKLFAAGGGTTTQCPLCRTKVSRKAVRKSAPDELVSLCAQDANYTHRQHVCQQVDKIVIATKKEA